MAITWFMQRPTATAAVQWTGNNVADVEELLTAWGWPPTMIADAVEVTGDVLSVNGAQVQSGQWYGLGMGGTDDTEVAATYQEVPAGPYAYVIEGGA